LLAVEMERTHSQRRTPEQTTAEDGSFQLQ
jgi:hypothetical protein